MTLFHQPVRQVAYFVQNVREAAIRHAGLFGSGPFFVIEQLRPRCIHRGARHDVEMSVALGQWGTQMIEFVQQNNSGPSIFRDVYPEGSNRYGFHHVALIVDSLDEAASELDKAGHPVACRFYPEQGYDVIFADATRSLGHMIELYEGCPALLGIYAFIAEAAIGYDGTRPVRELDGLTPQSDRL